MSATTLPDQGLTNTGTDASTLARRITIAAPTEQVWDAITSPEKVRAWLAPNVLIEPRVEGRYAFWGHTVYRGQDEGSATQTIAAWEPYDRLAIDWDYHGCPSTFEFLLAEAGSGTDLTIRFTLHGNAEIYPFYLAGDLVELCLHNLRGLCETGRPVCVPDYRQEPGRVELAVEVAGSPDDAFAALIEPAKMDQWVSSKAYVEPRVGGRYSYGWTETFDGQEREAGPTEILELEPGRRLVHGWRWGHEAETTVAWEVSAEDDQTVVSILHSGFAPTDDVPSYVQGWGCFLVRLESFLRGGPLPVKV